MTKDEALKKLDEIIQIAIDPDGFTRMVSWLVHDRIDQLNAIINKEEKEKDDI